MSVCSALSSHLPSEGLAPKWWRQLCQTLPQLSGSINTLQSAKRAIKKKKKTDPLLEVSSLFRLVKYEYLNQADKSRSKRSILNAMCASPARSRKTPLSHTNMEMNARLGLQKAVL